MNRIARRCMAALALLVVMVGASAQVKITPVPPPAGMVNPYGGIWPANDSFYPFQPTVVNGTSTGASATSTGSAIASRGGSSVGVSIPTSVSTSATRGAIASGAAKAWRGARALAGPVGVAYTAWTIYDAYKESGAYTCPPPDFFCFPPTKEADPYELGWSWTFTESGVTYTNTSISSGNTTMLSELRRVFPSTTATWALQPVSEPYDNGYRVTISAKRSDGVTRSYVMTKSGSAPIVTQKQGAGMSDADLEAKAQADMNSDPTGTARAKRYLDAIADANARAAASGRPVPVFPEDIFPNTAPTTVSGNPVTMPDAVTSTATYTDANGVQQTRTQVEKVTIQPAKQEGTGGATTIVKYITTTTTTTTTTNNNADGTAGPSKVETETKVDSPKPPELPKDYNKENTQLAVLRALQGEGITTKVDTNTDPHVKPVQDATKANETEVGKVTAAAYGIVSWFPQVPTAACKNPEVPNATGSGKSAVEICKPVDTLKTFISGVLCFFVLVACVREVQSALKA